MKDENEVRKMVREAYYGKNKTLVYAAAVVVVLAAAYIVYTVAFSAEGLGILPAGEESISITSDNEAAGISSRVNSNLGNVESGLGGIIGRIG